MKYEVEERPCWSTRWRIIFVQNKFIELVVDGVQHLCSNVSSSSHFFFYQRQTYRRFLFCRNYSFSIGEVVSPVIVSI